MSQKRRLRKLERGMHTSDKPMLVLMQDLEDREVFHCEKLGRDFSRSDFEKLGEEYLLFVVVFEDQSKKNQEIR